MSVSFLSELSWPEVKSLGEAGAWVLLPMGSTEAHGPHLPLCTDTLLSEQVAEQAAQKLSDEHQIDVIVGPSMPFGVTDFAAPFAGTISLREETLRGVIDDVVASLAKHGLKRICLINNHLEPGQLKVLTQAAEQWTERGDVTVIFANNCTKRWARTLTDEFKSGACHAGQYETSLVLAARPDLVKQDVARDLTANPTSLSWAIRDGAKDFVEAGGPNAYFGYPEAGTVEEGHESYALLVEMVVTEVLEA